MINIEYKNKSYEFNEGIKLNDVLDKFKSEYKNDVLVGSINNRLMSLNTIITKDCTVDFYDITTLLGNRTYERGLYFLLTKAVQDVLNCDVKIICTIDKGVYIEILSNDKISDSTVEKIKLRMDELVKSWYLDLMLLIIIKN